MLEVHLLPCLWVVSLFSSSTAWMTEVDTFTDECFFQRAEKDSKLGFDFEVVDGGFLDIDVTIKGPDERVIYSGLRETSGTFAFNAYEDGKYQFCFSNKMSTITPKWVMFYVTAGNDFERISTVTVHNSTIGTNATVLREMVTQLTKSLMSVQNQQDYLLVRTQIHHRVNEYTNNNVVRWTVFELVIVGLGVLFEAWYIKRFFEIRRII